MLMDGVEIKEEHEFGTWSWQELLFICRNISYLGYVKVDGNAAVFGMHLVFDL